MHGIFDVVGRPSQDLQDGVEVGVRLSPSQADRKGAVRPGDGVGDVRLGRDSVESAPPSTIRAASLEIPKVIFNRRSQKSGHR